MEKIDKKAVLELLAEWEMNIDGYDSMIKQINALPTDSEWVSVNSNSSHPNYPPLGEMVLCLYKDEYYIGFYDGGLTKFWYEKWQPLPTK